MFRRQDSWRGEGIQLPCGKCPGCLISRSREWAVRCVHESSLHEQNCFVTLTYADEFLPEGRNLCYEHFQLFMKRLRKRFQGQRIRFYMCGEYGEELGRPHYHALLFGFDFPDKEIFKVDKGIRTYTSSILADLWGKGFCSVGDVTFESAAYVARYVLKKQHDKREQAAHYRWTDPETGETFERVPEFTRMSLRGSEPGEPGGIGAEWFKKYKEDVYPDDFVTHKGRRLKTPRYYDRLLRRYARDEFEALKKRRREAAKERASDETPERLAVREEVLLSKINRLRRTLT